MRRGLPGLKVGVDLLVGLLKAFKTAGVKQVWRDKPFGLAAETEAGIVLDVLQMPLT
jgi:hypothetical protein